MCGLAGRTRIAAVVLHKYVVLLALLLLVLLVISGTVYAAAGFLFLHPGDNVAVYCMDLTRAESEKTFAGGVVVWCPADEAGAYIYLPVMLQD